MSPDIDYAGLARSIHAGIVAGSGTTINFIDGSNPSP
jgi:hypothetical protein